ncbi:MAG: dihydrodipicolinate synthase family protein [Gemmatimonadaceae bacterium]|nr:dihydrodipicolinate synthase family protein [Gemmatimonadaceae bacterium]
MGASDPRPLDLRAHLLAGQVIPAHPLALDERRRLDERHQRALTRYYVASGAGGIAVGVHTTQFEIREPQHGLLAPVLELASRTADDALAEAPRPFVKIAGVCGRTAQAMHEARLAHDLGYHAALVSLGAWRGATSAEMLAHCRALADVIPIVGFYLQPAVGGQRLDYAFWRAFAEIPNVVAIKIAPFNRYQTLDVVRAAADSGRRDIALYTGNDDTIVADLLTPFPSTAPDRGEPMHIVGGLLGHWAVWTTRAVAMLAEIAEARRAPSIDRAWLARAAAITDANGALFDVRHDFAGCIAGIHEVLRRQGLMRGIWCLNPRETLSPGQREEIDRVIAAYPWMTDDDFVAQHRDAWLR